MLVTSSRLGLQAQSQLASARKQPSLPFFAGKKQDAKDSVSFNRPSKGALATAALLLSNAGLAGAAPIKPGLALRNDKDIAPEAHTPAAAENPFALDLHDALNPASAWDIIEIQESTPDNTDAKRSDKADQKLKPRELTTSQAITILKKPPFAPTDKSVFNNAVYGAPAAKPAAARTQTVSQIKSELSKAFTKRGVSQSAIKLMDDAKLKAIVPDARLRGAIVNLMGTSGQGAIDTIRSGKFGSVKFVDLAPSYIARVTTTTGQKPVVEFNARYRHESLRLLSHALAHEVNHQDLTLSVPEERLAHAMDTLIHGKMILEDPTLIKTPTEFTQRLNTKLMARLNSRDKDGKLRIFQAQGNVYPGGKAPLANFGANFVNNAGTGSGGTTVKASSPGNTVFRDELKRTTGYSSSTANFDANSEAVVDKNQIVFTPVQLVNLAKVLKLKIS